MACMVPSPAVREYRGYGLRIRSPLALPFEECARSSAPPDVTIRFGAVAAAAHATGTNHASLWQAQLGVFLLHLPNVARYQVSSGREIRIEPCGGNHEDIVAFLLGTLAAWRGPSSSLHFAACAPRRSSRGLRRSRREHRRSFAPAWRDIGVPR